MGITEPFGHETQPQVSVQSGPDGEYLWKTGKGISPLPGSGSVLVCVFVAVAEKGKRSLFHLPDSLLADAQFCPCFL